ncbi:hypothetical protein FB451DRAFT_1392214 [Mycena latifolia]|nr:hypothetical protein FB451DRAFT_1392214 [Mycena latifolia]
MSKDCPYPLRALLPHDGDIARPTLPHVPVIPPRCAPRADDVTALPVVPVPAPLPLVAITTPRPDPQDLLWDIGLMSDGFHTFLTNMELQLVLEKDHIWAEYHERCMDCKQYVGLWGWGGYSYNPETECLDRASLLCKACTVFKSFGWHDGE